MSFSLSIFHNPHFKISLSADSWLHDTFNENQEKWKEKIF